MQSFFDMVFGEFSYWQDSPSHGVLLVSTTFPIVLPGFLSVRISWQLTHNFYPPKETERTKGNELLENFKVVVYLGAIQLIKFPCYQM